MSGKSLCHNDGSRHGSKFVAARTATDQIIDLRLTLRYLSVPVYRSVMFGDNESVVTSSTVPHSQLKQQSVDRTLLEERDELRSVEITSWCYAKE